MRISRLIIRNFRSAKSIDLNLNDFNVFVGQNNHGKTNILEALNWFYNGKKTLASDRFMQGESDIEVSVEFMGALEECEAMKNDKNKAAIKKILADSDVVTIYKSSSDHKRKIVVNGVDHGNPTGFDAALNDFLPRLQYVESTARLKEVSEYKTTTPIGQMLSGVLSAIIAKDPVYQQFRDKFEEVFENDDSQVKSELNALADSVGLHLQKQFPDGTTVKFSVETPEIEDLLKKFETRVND